MTTAGLPAGLGQAFRVAVAELGLCSASWLFVEEADAVGGTELVGQLRDELGRDWPVLDTVAAAHLDGSRRRDPNVADVLRACGPAERIVCVGLEAWYLDALVLNTTIPVSVVRQSVFGPDWQRVAANYEGRVEFEAMDTFQRLAGPRSVLLTFVYGTCEGNTNALPAWIRVSGADVRTQFRSLIGWEVMHRPFFVHPRWLVPLPITAFSALVQL